MTSDSERRIRDALVGAIREEFDWGMTLHELQLRSQRAFVDVAHINDKFHAFEIKSERDNFSRLRRQVQYYGEACSDCTLVVHEAHADSVFSVPSWWGIRIARETPDGTVVAVVREAQRNPDFNSRQLAQILRSSELGNILLANDPAAHISALTKEDLVNRVHRALGDDALEKLSLEVLRTRRTWTSSQLGVTSEEERLTVARSLPRPQLGILAPLLPLGASA